MVDQKIARSRKQEKRVAEQYRGSRQPMSGAGWQKKNDVRSEEFLIECKRTDNKRSITIKRDDLVALKNKAAKEFRTPVLQFDLDGRSYVILEDSDFRSLFT